MQINPTPELSKVGGKAYQLCRLEACCNVPAFFIIAFEDPREIDHPVVQDVILDQCRTRKCELMAVRSSASLEDSAYASFAGMFETVLNVREHALIAAIRRVLSSADSGRVVEYCRAHRLDVSKIRMAVIVQKMVRSRVSGVCFTRLAESVDTVMVEACLGLGEALVSGKVTPDTYLVDRNSLTIKKESIGYQTVMLITPSDNSESLTYVEVPFYRRNARKLATDEIRNVASAALLVERRLSFEAADVEWAFEREVLYILQARPYTGFVVSREA